MFLYAPKQTLRISEEHMCQICVVLFLCENDYIVSLLYLHKCIFKLPEFITHWVWVVISGEDFANKIQKNQQKKPLTLFMFVIHTFFSYLFILLCWLLL